MKHDHDTASAVAEVDIKNAYSESAYANLEACFCELRGVTGAHLNRTRGVGHLSYEPVVTTLNFSWLLIKTIDAWMRVSFV